MGVYVYVDGFNFYYRVFRNKGRHHKIPARMKWLDLEKLAQRLAPNQTIDWIGYFTADIKGNPAKHRRQRAYLSALETITCMEIVRGTYQLRDVEGVPKGAPRGTPPIAFEKFEEKGSDVNLGARLVWHAANGSFSQAIVITNDGDLREAIRIAVAEAGRIVHVKSPDLSVNNVLKSVATSADVLDVRLLRDCLFPDTMVNAQGFSISRPPEWR